MTNKTAKAFSYSVVIALGGFVFGFDASVISGVIGYVTKEFGLTAAQQGWIVGVPTLAAVFASLTVGVLADYFGRKRVLQFLALLYTVSAIASAFAYDFWSLTIARAIGGYAFGSLVLAPVFIAELSPAKLRGRLVAVNQLNIVVGLSAAYFVSLIFQRLAGMDLAIVDALGLKEHTWNWMLGVEAVPAFIWLVMLTFIPRSPRWLATAGKWEEAEEVLHKIAPPSEVQSSLDDIRSNITGMHDSFTARLGQLFSRKMMFILPLGIVIAIIQQITGINVVFFYAATIFELSGVGTDAAFVQAVSVGLVNVIFTFVAMAMIDSIGRKPLMIIGLLGVSLSLGLAAYGFSKATYTLDQPTAIEVAQSLERDDVTAEDAQKGLLAIADKTFNSDVEFRNAITDVLGPMEFEFHEAKIFQTSMTVDARMILFGILGFVASFAISLGPVMWVLLSEIFPVKIRGLAISLVTIFNSGTSFLVTRYFPEVVDASGIAFVFTGFTVFGILGLVFVVIFLPETKGLSLEEIEKKFVLSKG